MPDTIQIVTKDSFEKFVSRSLLPIMLVLYYQKYPSCKNLMETIQALEAKYRGSIQFGLVDADQQGELTGQLGIGGLPSILILNGGDCAQTSEVTFPCPIISICLIGFFRKTSRIKRGFSDF